MPEVIQHESIAPGDVHTIVDALPANAAARTALAWGVADIGKVAYQLDTRAFWLLRGNGAGGVAWFELGSAADIATNTASIATQSGQIAANTTAIAGKAAVTNAAPAQTTKAAAVVGVATDAARADHKHDVSTAAPATIGTANAEGTATSLARSDHVHDHGNQAGGALHADVIAGGASGFMSGTQATKLAGIATAAAALTAAAPADVTKAAAAVGVATAAARADHKHDISTGVPLAVGAANAEGTATSLARSDHVHAPDPTTTANSATLAVLDLFNPAKNQIILSAPRPEVPTAFAPVTAGGVFGTATARVPDNTNYASRKFRVGYVSAAGAGSSTGAVWYSAYAGNTGFFSRESGFALKLAAVLAAVSANSTTVIGVCIGLPTLTTPSNLLNSFFVGADSADTNMQVMYNDGAGACTKIDLGANFPARTAGDFYEAFFWCTPGSATINYTVTRHTSAGTVFTSSGTITGANVPAAGTQWSPLACMNNGAGGAVAIDPTGFTLAIPH